jgi:hypothetical protein
MRIVAGYAFLVPLCAIMAVEGANADPANPAHELLLNKSAADQAAILGKAVGNGCIGTTPFFMGHGGKWFWLLECSLRQWKKLCRACQP